MEAPCCYQRLKSEKLVVFAKSFPVKNENVPSAILIRSRWNSDLKWTPSAYKLRREHREGWELGEDPCQDRSRNAGASGTEELQMAKVDVMGTIHRRQRNLEQSDSKVVPKTTTST